MSRDAVDPSNRVVDVSPGPAEPPPVGGAMRADSEARRAGDTTQSVVRGARPVVIAQILTVATRAGVSLLTAVLLVPRDLGIIAIATTLMTFLDQIRDMGTGVALIQRAELRNSVVCTVFLFNLLLGGSVMLTQLAIAPPLASWLHEPRAQGILFALAPAAVVLSTGQVHHALLRRDLRYREIAIITMFSTVANAAVTIGGALSGLGAWALALGIGVGYAVDTLFCWYYDKWRPWSDWRVEWSALREVVGFSFHVFVANFVRFVFSQTDVIFVQRFLGTSALGLYAFVVRILSYPQSAISNIVGELTLPAFAKHQADDEALTRGLTRSAGVVAVLTFPMMAGLAAVARPAVDGVLADQWHDLTPLIWMLAPLGAGISISGMCGSILLAKGSGRRYVQWVVVNTIPGMVAFIIGLHWGLIGACALGTAAFFVFAPLYLYMCFRVIHLSVWRFLAGLIPTAAITGVMTAVVLGVDAVSSRFVPDPVVLFIGMVTGAAVYLGGMLLLRPAAFDDAIETILRRRRPVAADVVTEA